MISNKNIITLTSVIFLFLIFGYLTTDKVIPNTHEIIPVSINGEDRITGSFEVKRTMQDKFHEFSGNRIFEGTLVISSTRGEEIFVENNGIFGWKYVILNEEKKVARTGYFGDQDIEGIFSDWEFKTLQIKVR